MLKKNNNKKILIILVFLVQTIFAQPLFELDVNYGFGYSELSFNSVPGMAISIYPIKNFGISAGVQYSYRWQTRTSKYIHDTNSVVKEKYGEKDSLIFIYSIKKYEEKLEGTILQIPLLLKFSNDSYYASAGVKIGAVQKASASVDYSGLETEGYYPQYDLRISGPTAPTYQGFGKQEDSTFKTKISSKKSIMLTAESGVKAMLNDNFSMLIGIFADYSLNKSFDRDLKPKIERIENKNGASIAANDEWKSWKPWSVGITAKFSFGIGGHNKNIPQEICAIEPPVENHPPSALAQPPPQLSPSSPTPVLPMKMPIRFIPQKNDSAIIPDLPKFLLNRKADFTFYYPEEQEQSTTTDSLHLALTSQIANALREKPDAQLHCVGYSEKLSAASVAYETAFQRVIDIRSNLVRFYAIEEKRISAYSQGSKNTDYRRTECFVIENP
ncbi:MAG: hypothetical protein FWF67_02415 [Fibromonadales bacterium]|nr:hypothetical protein [Fibromonadales bacterium]